MKNFDSYYDAPEVDESPLTIEDAITNEIPFIQKVRPEMTKEDARKLVENLIRGTLANYVWSEGTIRDMERDN